MALQPAVFTAHDLAIGYTPRRGPAHTVAAGLNLTLHAGELVALLGPNGAGKSTLLRTLAGMQPPLAGEVQLAGRYLTRLTPRERAQLLSVVLTERVDVGNLSVYALVALGRHPYTDWRGTLTAQDEAVVRQALVAVDAGTLAHRPVFELSDGERQRVMIARALAQEPRLLLLDEPTAFLDLPRRVELLRLLRRLVHTRDYAILFSTHDLDLALRSADRLWLVASNGELRTGAPEDLVLNGSFADTFHREGVQFDMQMGTFQLTATTGPPVTVIGSGMLAHWTSRAIERAGFAATTEPATDWLVVTIVETAAQPAWQIALPGQLERVTVASLYELVHQLRQWVVAETTTTTQTIGRSRRKI